MSVKLCPLCISSNLEDQQSSKKRASIAEERVEEEATELSNMSITAARIKKM